MKATFEKSVDVLVKAYLNDTLEHNNCYACAVGNLVAHANGYKYTECTDKFFTHKRIALAINMGNYVKTKVGGKWYNAVDNERWKNVPNFDETRLAPQSYDEIVSTGYSFKQVFDIESAFESAEPGESEDEYMFNGLIAVVQVLAEIHGVDLSVKNQAVGRFEEIHATK